MRVVISQSMLFPWVGLLEQVRQADVFVHYDDVQFSRGSHVNRVQVKTAEGMRWMTVPLESARLGQRIDALQPDSSKNWREKHLHMLRQSFIAAPYADEALRLAEEVYASPHLHIGALARASLMALVRYFGLDAGRQFVDVADLNQPGASSSRVLSVTQQLCGTHYVTGHGAARYLDHEIFELAGVTVDYMDYQCQPYPQSHGAFTPFVTGLDLVAHCGRDGARYIASGTVGWREFIADRNQGAA
jgi:hypothetical protein